MLGEKIHFANAIGLLGLSVNSPRPPGMGWLRLCLSVLEQALTSKAQRNPDYIERSIAAGELSYEQFLKLLIPSPEKSRQRSD